MCTCFAFRFCMGRVKMYSRSVRKYCIRFEKLSEILAFLFAEFRYPDRVLGLYALTPLAILRHLICALSSF
jgi:hypothetical protein